MAHPHILPGPSGRNNEQSCHNGGGGVASWLHVVISGSCCYSKWIFLKWGRKMDRFDMWGKKQKETVWKSKT